MELLESHCNISTKYKFSGSLYYLDQLLVRAGYQRVENIYTISFNTIPVSVIISSVDKECFLFEARITLNIANNKDPYSKELLTPEDAFLVEDDVAGILNRVERESAARDQRGDKPAESNATMWKKMQAK